MGYRMWARKSEWERDSDRETQLFIAIHNIFYVWLHLKHLYMNSNDIIYKFVHEHRLQSRNQRIERKSFEVWWTDPNVTNVSPTKFPLITNNLSYSFLCSVRHSQSLGLKSIIRLFLLNFPLVAVVVFFFMLLLLLLLLL